jgi:hypothetical protein
MRKKVTSSTGLIIFCNIKAIVVVPKQKALHNPTLKKCRQLLGFHEQPYETPNLDQNVQLTERMLDFNGNS